MSDTDDDGAAGGAPSLEAALGSTPAAGDVQPRKAKQRRSRLVDRNSPELRVKEDDEARGGASAAVGGAGGEAADEAGQLADMLARERERQQAKKDRAAKKKRDAEIKKQQMTRVTLKKAMLYRHLATLENKLVNPPPPKPKEFKEAVDEPAEVQVDAQFTHPATTSYHTMKKLVTDPRRISPIFMGYPVDLQSARTLLVPDWKRALERKRPLPLHPAERSPAMIGYAMHARSGFDPAMISPIFYTYKTATGQHLDEEGIQVGFVVVGTVVVFRFVCLVGCVTVTALLRTPSSTVAPIPSALFTTSAAAGDERRQR
jgi:hypothetical protein